MIDIDDASKLTASEARYDELTRQLADVSIMQDQARYIALAKEHASLTPLVTNIKSWRSVMTEIRENEELLQESDDAELTELLREEINRLEQMESSNNRFDQNLNLIPTMNATSSSKFARARAVMKRRSSRPIFTVCTLHMLKRGRPVEIVDYNETELNGIKKYFQCRIGVPTAFKYESGAHRVRVPVTETADAFTRRPSQWPSAWVDEVDYEIDPKIFKSIRTALRAGGQHVTKQVQRYGLRIC